jgi:hypothetical protein
VVGLERAATRAPMLPPPAIMMRLTGFSMRRSSRITGRMNSVAASTKTSSPASMMVLPSGSTDWCSRKIAAMRASTRAAGVRAWP